MQLYDWQNRVIGESHTRPKRALFAAPRLGKTLAASTMVQELVDTSLVVAPLSVCGAWVNTLASLGIETTPLYFRSGQEAAKALYGDPDGAVIINYDKMPDLVPAIRAWNPDGVVFDESHLLKNPQSNRSKAARKLVGKADFVRILTGTPAPNHYGDLWAQMVLINPERWEKTFGAFARRFLVRHAIYPSKIIGYPPGALTELTQMLREDADIIRREDVFGPDTYQVIDRWVELPRKAREAYDTLVKEWLLYHERGEVLADHALTRLIRLQQLTSGFLHTEGGEDIDMHTAKIDAVLSDLDEIVESGEKAIIFHRYTWEGEHYARELASRFNGVPLRRMYGDTSAQDRGLVEQMVRTTNGAALVVAQTKTAYLGIDLSSAEHAMFVSQSFSYADEDQAKDRIYLPGAVRCVSYYRALNTTDAFIAGVLTSKSNIHNAVTHADLREMAYGNLRKG